MAVEQVQITLGKIDPVVTEILSDIAQDVRQLQGHPERVREACRTIAVVAGQPWIEDAERQPANRSRDASAVVDELVQIVVGAPAHIHLAPVDEFPERIKRDRQPACRVIEGHQDRIVGPGAWLGRTFAGVREQALLLGDWQRAVPDVVDTTSYGVDGRQRPPLGGGQQPDAPGEVAGLLPRDLFALLVGTEQFCRVGHDHRPMITRTECSAVPRFVGLTCRSWTS